MLKETAESRLPDSSPDHDSPRESFLDPEESALDITPPPQLERRSSYAAMTRMERETYDTAQEHWKNNLLFVPRMGYFRPGKVEDRLTKHYIRSDTMITLVDGTETAGIQYELFREVDPRLFVEVLRYAHRRHLIDRPGRLIEVTEHIIRNLDPSNPMNHS